MSCVPARRTARRNKRSRGGAVANAASSWSSNAGVKLDHLGLLSGLSALHRAANSRGKPIRGMFASLGVVTSCDIMDAQPSRDLPPVVEEAYQPSTSRSPVAPVGRNGWQVIETRPVALPARTLYYNATTGETALHPPSDLSEGWVCHPSAPAPRQSCLLIGRPSRKTKRQTADGLIAYLLATSEEFAKAYVQRREHVSGASTHRARAQSLLVLSPRREASGNASSSAAGADGAGSLPPVKSRHALPSAPRMAAPRR